MKKTIYILALLALATTSLYAQDPGFGDEGGGDGQDAPVTPINDIILPLLITGILTSIYYIRKKENQLN